MATTNIRKTLTDAGYIAVGLGVMGVQQAQRSGREVRAYLQKTGTCVHTRTREAQGKVSETASSAREQATAQVRTAKDQATSQVRTAREQASAQVRTAVDNTVGTAQAVRDGVTKRVEPTVGKVQSQLNDLPERVVQAMEPVTARVREIGGSAA